MSRKICFVAMGFGKKMDYRNSKEVDLDIIYKKVIKNLFTGARRNRYLDFLRVVPVEPRSARYANGLNYILTNHRLTH